MEKTTNYELDHIYTHLSKKTNWSYKVAHNKVTNTVIITCGNVDVKADQFTLEVPSDDANSLGILLGAIASACKL